MGNYLVDGIYPKWTTFVKIIPTLQGEKKKKKYIYIYIFAKTQEVYKKDVVHAFGVLQA